MKWVATLAVAAAAVGLSSAEFPCPDGFSDLGTDPVLPQCLGFVSSTGSWHNMLTACEMVGASLAKVTGDLHNSVYNYIQQRPELMDKCFWIGGTDEKTENQWVWVNDNSKIPLGGPHWDPCETEPNGGYDENYLAICPDRLYFKDYPGDRMHHAICQVFI